MPAPLKGHINADASSISLRPLRNLCSIAHNVAECNHGAGTRGVHRRSFFVFAAAARRGSLLVQLERGRALVAPTGLRSPGIPPTPKRQSSCRGPRPEPLLGTISSEPSRILRAPASIRFQRASCWRDSRSQKRRLTPSAFLHQLLKRLGNSQWPCISMVEWDARV